MVYESEKGYFLSIKLRFRIYLSSHLSPSLFEVGWFENENIVPFKSFCHLSPSLFEVGWFVNENILPFKSFCPRVDLTISLMLSTSGTVAKTNFRMLGGATTPSPNMRKLFRNPQCGELR